MPTPVQKRWIDRKLEDGRSVRGYKIGLTSRAMQKSSQIDEPDYGVLLDDMFFADGAVIETARFLVPRIEVELAFVLKDRLEGRGRHRRGRARSHRLCRPRARAHRRALSTHGSGDGLYA